MDEPTIIDDVFHKNGSINVDKQVVETRKTFLITNDILENKANGNKIFLWVKDQAKLASDDIIDNTLAPPTNFNTPTEAQISDLLEKKITEDSNSNMHHK